ncbi:hypothetical protein Tco_0138457 [Tanacetum coccineum]
MSSEYEQYLKADFVSHLHPKDFATFDVLGFWKAKENQFPVLSIWPCTRLTPESLGDVAMLLEGSLAIRLTISPNVEVSFFKLLCATDEIEDMTFDVYALPCYGLVLFVTALFIHAL